MGERTIEVEETVTNTETVTVCDVCGLGEDEGALTSYESATHTIHLHDDCVPYVSEDTEPEVYETTVQNLHDTASRQNVALREQVLVLPVSDYAGATLAIACIYGLAAAISWAFLPAVAQAAVGILAIGMAAVVFGLWAAGTDGSEVVADELFDRA